MSVPSETRWRVSRNVDLVIDHFPTREATGETLGLGNPERRK
ncbi:hypothetical protein RSSM_01553 [Rhodopirellula sallentina SM41]|uniref:Uncharacterized protein n=1 Tax=Rhodopirellula sallentina SM41 TaxID=1263870 RepID=M5U6W2_9BACT|nr:hypothetical protein RSSM_01553 [Rhodopirellula sallentina SM41]